jgi:hypothetical protein
LRGIWFGRKKEKHRHEEARNASGVGKICPLPRQGILEFFEVVVLLPAVVTVSGSNPRRLLGVTGLDENPGFFRAGFGAAAPDLAAS